MRHTASDAVFEKLTGIKGAFRTRIAYVVQTNGGQFPYELRVSDYDGYNQFLVHRSSQPLMSPAWSPDGSKLAYVTFESGRSALVIRRWLTALFVRLRRSRVTTVRRRSLRMVLNWRLRCRKPVA
jgi:Tol biopolymer transport system component